jgi:hypothetical protein
MKKTLIILIICFMVSGCSALKMITAPFTPTVSNAPQQTDKSYRYIYCQNGVEFDNLGNVVGCQGKYKSKEKNYSQSERKLTLWEKVKQHVYKFFGYYLIGMGLLFFFVPSLFWMIIQRQANAFKQLVKAVQRARKEKVELNQALSESMDESTKKQIVKLKQKNNIK